MSPFGNLTVQQQLCSDILAVIIVQGTVQLFNPLCDRLFGAGFPAYGHGGFAAGAGELLSSCVDLVETLRCGNVSFGSSEAPLS